MRGGGLISAVFLFEPSSCDLLWKECQQQSGLDELFRRNKGKRAIKPAQSSRRCVCRVQSDRPLDLNQPRLLACSNDDWTLIIVTKGGWIIQTRQDTAPLQLRQPSRCYNISHEAVIMEMSQERSRERGMLVTPEILQVRVGRMLMECEFRNIKYCHKV